MQSTYFAVFSALALTGCRSISEVEFVNLARQAKIRCLVVEHDLAVVSPFDAGKTDILVMEIRRSLVSLEEQFEVDVAPNLLVRFEKLHPSEVFRQDQSSSTWDLRRSERPNRHGVSAYAVSSPEASTVTVFIAPEFTLTMEGGQELPFNFDPAGVRATIRHELAHVCAKQAGLDGPPWFDEGLAEELESWELTESGTFAPVPLPGGLQLARDGHEPFTIDTLLDWEENSDQVMAGNEQPFCLGRPLAQSLIRFLLENTSGKSLRQRLQKILAMDHEEIRAMGKEWKAWLKALPQDD